MFANAVYRDGIARTPDGAVYVITVASGSVVPVTANGNGAGVSPAGQKTNSDGAIYVRQV